MKTSAKLEIIIYLIIPNKIDYMEDNIFVSYGILMERSIRVNK